MNTASPIAPSTRRTGARRARRMRRFEDHVYIVAFSGSLAEIDMYLGTRVAHHRAPPRSRWSRVGPATAARTVGAARERRRPRRASCSPP